MQLRGLVKRITDEIVVGKDEKKTTKIVVCIEEEKDVESPDTLAIDFIGDKKDLLEGLKEGDTATIYFGTKYNRRKGDSGKEEEKIFNSIKGWKVADIKSPIASKAPEDDLPF